MLTALQTRLQQIVQEEPLLADRPVLIEDKNNLVSQVEQTLAIQSLAVVVSPVSGAAKDGQPKTAVNSTELFEIVIHRSPIDTPDTPSTVAVLDALRARVHGALVNPAALAPSAGARWRYVSWQLREIGDGNYARALVVAVDATS